VKKYSKLITALLAVLLVAAMVAGCTPENQPGGGAGSEKRQVVIFTWADYLPQEVLDRFTAETGIEVVYTYFTSNDEMLAKLSAANGGTYDLVLAGDYVVDIARKQNLMQEIDKGVVTNFKDIDPKFQGQFFDEENKYTVPYAAGSPVIVYNPALVGDVEITGYNSWWDEGLRNKLVLIDDARVMLGMSLKSMGYSLNETDPELIRAAGEKLKELGPNIIAYDYDTPHEKLITDEAAVGFMFTSQASWAVMERPDLKVVYPEEGMGFGIDSFFITSNAPNAKEANEFLNFILQGEVSAELSLFTQYMNCVTTAKEFLPEEYFNDVLYIPAEILGETEYIVDIGAEAEAIYAEVWVQVKQ
jgi:spermidine/putrescine transport system substrate-binding protein